MITVYLNVAGNCKEVAHYYAEVFEADEPMIMRYADLPPEEQQEMEQEMGGLDPNFVVHANVATFGGNLMLSDSFPGQNVVPNSSFAITLMHPDEEKIKRTFTRLAQEGTIQMPLEPTSFSALFGSLRDKYGFHWLIMADENA